MRTEINAKALANTARECIKMAAAKNQTIAKIIAHWNLCVEQSGFTGSYDFPTVGYSRKAQLITELENCAEQLDAFNEKEYYAGIEAQRVTDINEAHDAALLAEYGLDAIKYVSMFPFATISHEEAHALALEMNRIRDEESAFHALIETQRAAGLPVDEEGNDTREWCGNDIEAAHAEAMALNKKGEELKMFKDPVTPEKGHAEGLSMNDAIDTASLVIRAMAGMEIKGIMSGIRAGMFNSGHDDVVNLSSTALRVELNRAHAEALAHDDRRNQAISLQADFFSTSEASRNHLIEFAWDQALAYNLQYDFNELSWDVQALALENAEDEARTIEYCSVALEEGAGGLTGYVIEVSPGKYLDLSARAPTDNPLKASYFEPEEQREGKLRQFCMNGEKPVRLGDAVVDVAFNTMDYRG